MDINFQKENDLPSESKSFLYATADIKRKSLLETVASSCGRLDNASVCELLGSKFENYNGTIFNEGNQNIYCQQLTKIFPNIASNRQFKVPNSLPKLDLDPFLSNLNCSSNGKLSCDNSETIGQAESNQFEDFLNTKNTKPNAANAPFIAKSKISLEARFENLNRLQNQIPKTLESAVHNNLKEEKQIGKKAPPLSSFVSARDELENQIGTKIGSSFSDYSSRKKLGLRRNIRSKFVSPILSSNNGSGDFEENVAENQIQDDRLKNIEPKMVELIKAEIMDNGLNIEWKDIAGLEFAKSAIQESVIWPMLRPDIFTGLKRPPKAILLFGPPGTGKTLIGKCVASQSKSTFFNISASSLTSKWIGDGEKMVRALFAVARVHQPSIIFIDEVDSLLTQRSDTEHESSRRIKTEFLVQLDGASTDSEERLLLIGATNRPQELDEAARRRFVKRLYIPLPELDARLELVKRLIINEKHTLSQDDFEQIAELSKGFSGADIKNLCSEASLGPIRSIDFNSIEKIQASEVRPLTMDDFHTAFKRVRASVSQNDLVRYVQWNQTYGAGI